MKRPIYSSEEIAGPPPPKVCLGPEVHGEWLRARGRCPYCGLYAIPEPAEGAAGERPA